MSEETTFTAKRLTTSDTDPLPVKQWRCSRGHEWEGTFPPTFFLEIAGLDRVEVCAICMRDWMREYCGKVREVK